jgi:hypothetical protein
MILFEELLNTDDFAGAVDSLCPEFCKTHDFPPIDQLGLVVADVEEAARALESRGIGPFFIAAGAPEFWQEKGQARSIQGKLALAPYQGFELELLESAEGTDFYSRSLDPQGRIVVQHIGFEVDDVDKWAEKTAAAGIPVWVRGGLKLGPARSNFAYLDSEEQAGLILEFISRRTFGFKVWPIAVVYRALAHIGKWTGKRSISL